MLSNIIVISLILVGSIDLAQVKRLQRRFSIVSEIVLRVVNAYVQGHSGLLATFFNGMLLAGNAAFHDQGCRCLFFALKKSYNFYLPKTYRLVQAH